MKSKKVLAIILVALALVGGIISAFVVTNAATYYQVYYGSPDHYNNSSYDSVGYVKYESEYFTFDIGRSNEYNYTVLKNANNALQVYCSEGGKLFGNRNDHLMFVGKDNILAFMDGSSGELRSLDADFVNWNGTGKTYYQAHLKNGYTLSDYLDGMSVILQYANHHYNWFGLSDDALFCATSVAFHAFPQLVYNIGENNIGYGNLADGYASEFPGIHAGNRVSIDTAGNVTTSWHASNNGLTAEQNAELEDFTKNLLKLAYYNVPVQSSMTFSGTTNTPEVSSKVINMKESGTNYIADVELTIENLPNGQTIGTPTVRLGNASVGTVSVLSGPTVSNVKEDHGKYYVPKQVTKITYRVTIPKTNNAEKTFNMSLQINGFLDKDSDLICLANTRYNVGGNPWSGIRLYQAMYAFDAGSISHSDTITLKTPKDVVESYVTVIKSVPSGYIPTGAKFGIYASQSDASGDNNRLTTLTVDASGNAPVYKYTLPAGATSATLYAKEISGPSQTGDFQWINDSHIASVTVTEANTSSNPAKFTFNNTVQEFGYAVVQKTVPSGYVPTGAEYTVYTDANCTQPAGASVFANGTVQKFIINANGTSNTIKFKVPTGGTLTLYVKETKVPSATGNFTWNIDQTKYTMSISKANTSSNPTTIRSSDTVKEYGHGIVYKKVPSGYRPTGAEYTVYADAACTQPLAASYFASGSVQKFVITADGSSNIIKFNVPVGGSLTVYVKETKKPSQAENEFVWNMDTKIYTMTMSKNNPDSRPFRVDSENTVVEYGYGYIVKTSDKPAANALMVDTEFTVYNADGTIAKDFLTGANVVLRIKNVNGSYRSDQFCLRTGTYTIKETAVPDGFTKADDRTITITKSADPKVITIQNHYLTTFVSVSKTSDRPDMINTYPLVGTKFGVYTDRACTTLAKDINTGADCILTVNTNLKTNEVELPVGTYYVKEISTTEWYDLNTQTQSRAMKVDQKHEVFEFSNYLKKGLGKVEKGYK